jgi:hypothetical protein
MDFKRIEPKKYKIRRLQVSEEIRYWAKIKIMEDTRPYGQKARIQDVWLHLVSEGLKLKNEIVFSNKYVQTKLKTATNRTNFPVELHGKIERVRKAVEAGKLKREGAVAVDSYNIIMCLIEAAFNNIK